MKTTLAILAALTLTAISAPPARPVKERPIRVVPRIREAAGIVFKTRDVTTRDNQVLCPKPDEFLFLPVKKGETWHFKFVVYYFAGDTADDFQDWRFQCGLTFPQGLNQIPAKIDTVPLFGDTDTLAVNATFYVGSPAQTVYYQISRGPGATNANITFFPNAAAAKSGSPVLANLSAYPSSPNTYAFTYGDAIISVSNLPQSHVSAVRSSTLSYTQNSAVRYTMRYQSNSLAGVTSTATLTGDNTGNCLDSDVNPAFPSCVEFEGVLLDCPSDGKIQFHWGRNMNPAADPSTDYAEVHATSYILAHKQ